jgi:hypothetical protein
MKKGGRHLKTLMAFDAIEFLFVAGSSLDYAVV